MFETFREWNSKKLMKSTLSCFDDKTYIQDSGNDGLALGY